MCIILERYNLQLAKWGWRPLVLMLSKSDQHAQAEREWPTLRQLRSGTLVALDKRGLVMS